MHLKVRPETLTLQVVPGAKGEFSFYEDEGNSADYATAYTRTLISQVTEGTKTTLTIAPRTGSFEGMPEERAYRIEFLARDNAPDKVTVDGANINSEYDAESRKVIVSIPKKECSSTITVTIE